VSLREIWRLIRSRVTRDRPLSVEVFPAENIEEKSFDIGLVITTYDRPAYVRATFEQVASSELENTIVAVVDDGSSDAETLRMVRNARFGAVPVVRIFRRGHRGFAVHECLRLGWDILARDYGCLYLTNLDSDAIVRPQWLDRVAKLFRAEREHRGPLIATGFNATAHEVIAVEDDYYVKRSIGGQNMFFDASLYRDVVRPNLIYDPTRQGGWDQYVVRAMRERGYPFVCTRPSVIQHIGKIGQFSNPRAGFDTAADF
jgi:glycosyltransferase involved in cell wall biosynthesis